MNLHKLRPHMLNNLSIKIGKTVVAVKELHVCVSLVAITCNFGGG